MGVGVTLQGADEMAACCLTGQDGPGQVRGHQRRVTSVG